MQQTASRIQITKNTKCCLKKMELVKGLSLDIDETLAWTVGHLFELMRKRFGDPDPKSSVKELVAKYGYTWNVPMWAHQEANDWIQQQIKSQEFFMQILPIEGAIDGVKRLTKDVPLSAYITARPVEVETATNEWLKKHQFPKAPLILRPPSNTFEDRHAWKAKVLKEKYPQVVGIIDDDKGILPHLNDYKGLVILYGHKNVPETNIKVYACLNWEEIHQKAADIFRANHLS